MSRISSAFNVRLGHGLFSCIGGNRPSIPTSAFAAAATALHSTKLFVSAVFRLAVDIVGLVAPPNSAINIPNSCIFTSNRSFTELMISADGPWRLERPSTRPCRSVTCSFNARFSAKRFDNCDSRARMRMDCEELFLGDTMLAHTTR